MKRIVLCPWWMQVAGEQETGELVRPLGAGGLYRESGAREDLKGAGGFPGRSIRGKRGWTVPDPQTE